MQGPITVFDGGASTAIRRSTIWRRTDRLISYALDLKTEVEPKIEGGTQELATVSLKKGAMLVSRRLVEDRTPSIRNRDQKSKTVLIEHPYRADWKLVEPKHEQKQRETYRFSVIKFTEKPPPCA